MINKCELDSFITICGNQHIMKSTESAAISLLKNTSSAVATLCRGSGVLQEKYVLYIILVSRPGHVFDCILSVSAWPTCGNVT